MDIIDVRLDEKKNGINKFIRRTYVQRRYMGSEILSNETKKLNYLDVYEQ